MSNQGIKDDGKKPPRFMPAVGLGNMSKWIYTNGLYEPKVNNIGEYLESVDEYFLRMRSVLPNFPKEVLIQWFYEHWNDIDNFAWLNFEKLNFECARWSASEILSSGTADHEVIKTYQLNYEKVTCSVRMKSLSSFFNCYGTCQLHQYC